MIWHFLRICRPWFEHHTSGVEGLACFGIPDRYDQLGLGGALDDGDGIPIRESSLLGGKDVVDGYFALLLACVLVVFVHSC